MTQSSVFLHTYEPPPMSRREILRYMGERSPSDEVLALLESCIEEVGDALTYRVCGCVYPLTWETDGMDLGFAHVTSRDLAKTLTGCDRILVFAATVGLGIDRLISRYNRLSPVRALCMQAIGSERVEALCNAFCHDITTQAKETGDRVGKRFSPGYGDLPLTLQREIFDALGCAKHLGITLQDSLLMIPTKSVTAIMGIGKEQA